MLDLNIEPISLNQRLRRNRKMEAIRELVQETRLHVSDFVAPLFIMEGHKKMQTIESMPDVFRLSLDLAVKETAFLYANGIRAINLFTVIPTDKKDPKGSEAIQKDNLLQRAIRAIKREVCQMCVMADIALDPFTDHGHDGIVDSEGNILNDETLHALSQMATLAAESGVDIVAPSDMMDGRVKFIRETLDKRGFTHVGILSYAAKYASSLYGPFRDALNSCPKFGDKKTYQLNPANAREALLECILDEREGADMLMVKPAMPYLDILAKLRLRTDLPLAAYQVSGEYAMIMAAAEKGWIDGDKALLESLLCIKRAGADFIFSYAAKKVSHFLNNS